jgi:hypothetical protein
MRLTSLCSVLTITLTAAACGDDGGKSTPDAPKQEDIGFNKPTGVLKANYEVSKNNWKEIGPANLACLGTPSSDVATTVAVTLNTKVDDFQSGNPVPGTVVTAFRDQDTSMMIAGPATSDTNAMLSLSFPAGVKRFGFKMTNSNSLDTLLLNQTLDPTAATQMIGHIQSVSTATAQTLPALIGVSRTPGTGILAGAVRDCGQTGRMDAGKDLSGPQELSNYVATVSSVEATATSTPDVVMHLPGVDSYYFSASVGLPVRHSQQDFSSKDGLFMAIEMQPTPTAYVQIWGYKTDADLAADKLSLIAQLKTAVIADVVITGSYEPLRTP